MSVAHISSLGSFSLPIATMFAPIITGIDIKKENFNAFFSFNPTKSPEEIVIPERDTPGKSASACAIPVARQKDG